MINEGARDDSQVIRIGSGIENASGENIGIRVGQHTVHTYNHLIKYILNTVLSIIFVKSRIIKGPT
jgi:hypothetical protein